MKIRRWEIVDTQDGEVFAVVSRHLSRRFAEFKRSFYAGLLRYRPGYELEVRRRA